MGWRGEGGRMGVGGGSRAGWRGLDGNPKPGISVRLWWSWGVMTLRPGCEPDNHPLRNLSYQPNNVSFVWGNLVEGRGLVTIDYIFTALLYYVLKSSSYMLQILFSWQLWKFFQLQNYYTTCKSSQLSSGGTKTHSQVFKLHLIPSLQTSC